VRAPERCPLRRGNRAKHGDAAKSVTPVRPVRGLRCVAGSRVGPHGDCVAQLLAQKLEQIGPF